MPVQKEHKTGRRGVYFIMGSNPAGSLRRFSISDIKKQAGLSLKKQVGPGRTI